MMILRIYSIVVLIFTLLIALIDNRKKVDGVSLSIAELILYLPILIYVFFN